VGRGGGGKEWGKKLPEKEAKKEKGGKNGRKRKRASHLLGKRKEQPFWKTTKSPMKGGNSKEKMLSHTRIEGGELSTTEDLR